MNFLEAISSGKPFKRPKYKKWIIENPESLQIEYGKDKNYPIEEILKGMPFIWEGSGESVYFARLAMLATDWETRANE